MNYSKQNIQKKNSYYMDHSLGTFIDIDLTKDEEKIDAQRNA